MLYTTIIRVRADSIEKPANVRREEYIEDIKNIIYKQVKEVELISVDINGSALSIEIYLGTYEGITDVVNALRKIDYRCSNFEVRVSSFFTIS